MSSHPSVSLVTFRAEAKNFLLMTNVSVSAAVYPVRWPGFTSTLTQLTFHITESEAGGGQTVLLGELQSGGRKGEIECVKDLCVLVLLYFPHYFKCSNKQITFPLIFLLSFIQLSSASAFEKYKFALWFLSLWIKRWGAASYGQNVAIAMHKNAFRIPFTNIHPSPIKVYAFKNKWINHITIKTHTTVEKENFDPKLIYYLPFTWYLLSYKNGPQGRNNLFTRAE